MGKLGTHGTALKSLRWYSNYQKSKPLTTSVIFKHESEQFESQFQICLILDELELKVFFHFDVKKWERKQTNWH